MVVDVNKRADTKNFRDETAVEGDNVENATTLHERLVAYVHAVAEERDVRSGVWVEHSYARARSNTVSGDVRVLLASRPSTDVDDVLDVEAVPASPPVLPTQLDDVHPMEDEEEASEQVYDDQWEERIIGLAPSASHARLAHQVFEVIHTLRLTRLVGGWGRREAARAAARQLRRALAPLWAWGGPPQQRPVAWLHSALQAYLPRPLRLLYDETVAEVARKIPRLAERFLAGRTPVVSPDPLEVIDGGSSEEVSVREDASANLLLVWVCASESPLEIRWERRLRTLLDTKSVHAWVEATCSPPDAYCAALAAVTRTQINEILADAGERAVVVGGAGAGAALAAAAVCGASAGRVRGLVLLAPPLLTPEGPRDTPDDPLHETKVPILCVCGTGGVASSRSAACALAARAGRRVLLVAGADDALRLPSTHRRARRLPQRALDAAIAEECARWASELAENETADTQAPDITLLSTATPKPTVATHVSSRSIEIVEGRVVPRRVSTRNPPPPAVAPAPAADASASTVESIDIMKMPIVFADDDAQLHPPPEVNMERPTTAAMTVTSGKTRMVDSNTTIKYTRVIVAKRGRGAGGGPRTVLARRPLRLVTRRDH